MRRPTQLVSFWSFVALAAMLALQAFPYTGIFLILFGAALICGALVNVFLISLLFEAVTRRIPLVFVVVPLAAYGWYYALYVQQTNEIARKSDELRASNPGKVLDFDPNSQSLVTAEAGALVTHFAVPVAYAPNDNFKPEGHLSYRLIRRDQCNIRKDSQHRIQTFGMHLNNHFQKDVCVLHVPEAPTGKIVTAVRTGDDDVWKRKREISEQVTTIAVDGKVLGAYRSASVWRLPIVPIGFIGCALVDSTPAWKCGADFVRTHTVIDAVPSNVDRKFYTTPLSVMLGLKKYTEADLAGFRSYAINDRALARIAAEPARIEEDAFKTLAAILAGENPPLPFNMGNSLTKYPERLVPFADKMAARFVELNPSNPKTDNQRSQTHILATALASLPRATFLDVVDQVSSVMQAGLSVNRFPALYVRSGDAGVKTLKLYKTDFMNHKLRPSPSQPVLAICRIGQADDETIAEMKRRFRDASSNEDYKSALFVALLKLGQESYLRENLPTLPTQMRDWEKAVLENKGTTEVGPNNCMSLHWSLGPMLEPSLRWTGRDWTPQARTN